VRYYRFLGELIPALLPAPGGLTSFSSMAAISWVPDAINRRALSRRSAIVPPTTSPTRQRRARIRSQL